MKQPWYRKLLSYVYDITIEETASIFNDYLVVLLSKGEYQLCTPEAIYSYGRRYDNYYTALKKSILPAQNSEALILGLGLASIPYMLEKYMGCSYTYTCVEIDPEIIRLAHTYVLDDLSSPVVVYETDALYFVQNGGSAYRFIAIDIFVSDYIPEEFQTLDFLENCKALLAPGGLLLLNRLYLFEHDKKETQTYYEEVFLKVFPEGTFIQVDTNWMLVNDKSLLR